MTTREEATKLVKSMFLPGDEVWIMDGNEPRRCRVYSVKIEKYAAAIGPLVCVYKVWPCDTLLGVIPNLCRTLKKREVFKTKQELINSL